MSTNSAQLKIAIVGAGPVSLTLANILQNNNIPFSIFEAADRFRTSGGSLDLHPESGQLALKEAGLWDAFVQNSRPESDCDKVVNIDGEVLWDENLLKKEEKSMEEQFAGRPEIDRRLLMKILFDNLKSEHIVFGKKLDHITPSSSQNTKYNLNFVDGTQDNDFDLIIGSDGAWSKVRTLLSDTKPQYSGISMLEVNCTDISANPWLLNYVGIGSMFAFGEGKAVIAQRQGDGSLRTYAALRVPENFLDTCGIDWTQQDTARKQFVDKYFSEIGEDLKRVVLECKDTLTPRSLYELPVGFSWPDRSGITLVGDAAHVMTPFAGVGVNVGMTDALVLGREIVAVAQGRKGLDEGVVAYEREMFPRAKKYMARTEKGKVGHFSADGSKHFADRMRAHHEQGAR
ncbi:FAD/NAD(P)-binding domain-containing protein [Setomelanomma holmii]|uniref:FAD/NAD(P)-binding domain-containing protein n=1 Tax=Setomelanomma holmii TaxID=210430 RepID=A0A9P4GZV2_9PLEO|nr:FAD/NAD(P)-binding domain-containing protein [Setomelanomma holmii]